MKTSFFRSKHHLVPKWKSVVNCHVPFDKMLSASCPLSESNLHIHMYLICKYAASLGVGLFVLWHISRHYSRLLGRLSSYKFFLLFICFWKKSALMLILAHNMMLLVNSRCTFNGNHLTSYTGELSLHSSIESSLESRMLLGILDMLQVASLVLLILVLFI